MHPKFHSTKSTHRARHASLAVVALIIFYGCNAGSRPTAAILRNAELEIGAADDAHAAEFAAVDLKNARDKLARAQQALAASRYEDARRLAERAQVDAELGASQGRSPADAPNGQTEVLKRSDVPSTKAESELEKTARAAAEQGVAYAIRFAALASGEWARGNFPSGVTAIGCATVRNPSLENARDAYQKARQDPLIVRNAGAALDRAQSDPGNAEQIWTKERDVDEVEHLAYIAEKRVEIARVIAAAKTGGGRTQEGFLEGVCRFLTADTIKRFALAITRSPT